MPDSFFATKTRKRKRNDTPGSSRKKAVSRPGAQKKGQSTTKAKQRRDEELDSDETPEDGFDAIDDLDLRANDEESFFSDDEDANETPAQKRLRLAKVYLDGLREELGEGEVDAAEVDREIIAARLQRDAQDQEGKVYLHIADSLDLHSPLTAKIRLRGHKSSVTAATASSNCRYLFAAGKEGSITKWDLHTGQRISTFAKIQPAKSKNKGKRKPQPSNQDEIQGHTDEIWALALSTDGRYLASGGKDRRVGIWDADKGQWLKGFRGHKDTVSALVFRKNSPQLYSASYDRTVKLFDLGVMGYVETLFGHQDSIGCIDALRRETAVTSGARDKTVRFWKITEESQLVFRGGTKSKLRELLEGGIEGADNAEEDVTSNLNPAKQPEKEKRFVEGSIDCVAMVDETTFVSGGDSGTIALWIIQKKKPVFIVPVAHGLHETHSETEGIVATPRWITALACTPYSDLLCSGSWEGCIRLWKIDPNPRNRTITLLTTILAPGFINSLQLITVPSEFSLKANWVTAHPESETAHDGITLSSNGLMVEPSKKSTTHVDDHRTRSGPGMVIAGIGREPRTGRWMCLKGEEGTVNAAMAFLLQGKSG